jgi:hypothetical protein
MFTKTKIVLSAALILSTAFTASAATKARQSHFNGPMIYDMVPDRSAPPSAPARDYVTDPIMAPESSPRQKTG